ncbi:MAG: ABC transporter permease [Clostridia bacterium]|nr:ABC transporter permease [Clostridia bacterium]
MKIVLKHTLKNIFKKPFRTILVVTCVWICAFTALLSFDMTGSIRYMLSSLFSSQLGSIDVIVSGQINDEFINDSKFNDCNVLKYYDLSEPFYSDIDGQYAYVHKDDLCVMGLDIKAAKEMGCLTYSGDITDTEALLSKDFADKYGFTNGSTITFHNAYGIPTDFTIKEVVDFEDKGMFRGDNAVITENAYLTMNPNSKCVELYLDIPDSASAKSYVDFIEENYPNVTATSIYEDDEIENEISNISRLFLILFAVCMLMVIFVTISVSERIVSERMATVGTLRSLGLSVELTTFILLLENAIYGVVGALIGCGLYTLVRNVFLGSLFTTTLDVELTFGSVNPLLITAIVIGAVLIECLCPIKEVIKAAKTPIRDIIFANKDTEYKTNKVTTIIGLAAVALSLILFFFNKYFWVAIIQFALMTVALACLFPYVICFAGRMLEKLFIKLHKPSLQLAATELYTKKSTVGGATLISTAVALAIVVCTFANSLLQNYDYEMFTSEVYVSCSGFEDYEYSFIEHLEGVKDTEYVYMIYDYVYVNDVKIENIINVIGQDDDGLTYFKTLPEAPALSENEIAVGRKFAEVANVSEGDVITVKFGADGYYPLYKEFTVAKVIKTTLLDSTEMSIVINDEVFKDVFNSRPSYIFVSCDNPVEVDSLIEKYADDKIVESYTIDEYNMEAGSNQDRVITVLYIAIAIGVILTFIGAVTNMLVGFEGRKRECAVILSTSMSRKKLSSVFRMESFLSSGIALLTAFPIGILMTVPVFKALSAITFSVDKVLKADSLIIFVLIMWVLFTLTSIFPIRALKKMKLAEQLKYE